MNQSPLEARLESDRKHTFRSEGERRIAATLDEYQIPFIYEMKVPVNNNGKARTFRPDFYLPEFNLYIEYYGRVGNGEYDLRISQKQTLYAANNLNVLPVYPWNLIQRWPEYLLEHLTSPTTQRRSTYAASGIRRPRTRTMYQPAAPRRRPYDRIATSRYR